MGDEALRRARALGGCLGFSVVKAFAPLAPTADLLTCTPGVRSAKACVSGMGHDESMADVLDLQPEHIQGVLCDAAEREKHLSKPSVV